MSDGTKIEWTDATANVVNGCTVVSPGCANCYAMKQAHRFPVRQGLTRQSPSGMTWTGEVRFSDSALQQVLRWKRPRRIFWNAHGDLFHPKVPRSWQDRCYAGMALTSQHTHQLLTKRSEARRDYLNDPETPGRIYELVCDMVLEGEADVVLLAPGVDEHLAPQGTKVRLGLWPLPNVWEGTSVEDQQRADERIPVLLDTPAAVRWISAEPLLGPVELRHWLHDSNCPWDPCICSEPREVSLDWVVVGGESGPGARPMHPDWARSLRDQCLSNDVPFLFKQWGEWLPLRDYSGSGFWPTAGKGCCRLTVDGDQADAGYPLQRVGKRHAGRLLDGVQHDGYPA